MKIKLFLMCVFASLIYAREPKRAPSFDYVSNPDGAVSPDCGFSFHEIKTFWDWFLSSFLNKRGGGSNHDDHGDHSDHEINDHYPPVTP